MRDFDLSCSFNVGSPFSYLVGTCFSPTCNDIREMLDRLMETMVNTVGNVNRVSYLNSKSSGGNVGANIQHIIRESRRFRDTLQKIEQRVVLDFERAAEHAQSYESVRPIYDFNAQWDFEVGNGGIG